MSTSYKEVFKMKNIKRWNNPQLKSLKAEKTQEIRHRWRCVSCLSYEYFSNTSPTSLTHFCTTCGKTTFWLYNPEEIISRS